jgi:hypothetical protein
LVIVSIPFLSSRLPLLLLGFQLNQARLLPLEFRQLSPNKRESTAAQLCVCQPLHVGTSKPTRQRQNPGATREIRRDAEMVTYASQSASSYASSSLPTYYVVKWGAASAAARQAEQRRVPSRPPERPPHSTPPAAPVRPSHRLSPSGHHSPKQHKQKKRAPASPGNPAPAPAIRPYLHLAPHPPRDLERRHVEGAAAPGPEPLVPLVLLFGSLSLSLSSRRFLRLLPESILFFFPQQVCEQRRGITRSTAHRRVPVPCRMGVRGCTACRSRAARRPAALKIKGGPAVPPAAGGRLASVGAPHPPGLAIQATRPRPRTS